MQAAYMTPFNLSAGLWALGYVQGKPEAMKLADELASVIVTVCRNDEQRQRKEAETKRLHSEAVAMYDALNSKEGN